MKAAYGVVTRITDVPSSAVTRLVIELPIEFHVAAVQQFYGKRVLVTLTDLVAAFGIIESNESEPAGAATVPTVPPEKGGSLAKSAGILCGTDNFRRFVAEDNGLMPGSVDVDDAAEYIRLRCGVGSRAHLDHSSSARELFASVMADFRAWLEGQPT